MLLNCRYLVVSSKCLQQPTVESPALQSSEQLEQYVSEVRQGKLYAAEAYSLNLSDSTTGVLQLIIGIIPEATKGCVWLSFFGLMAVEKSFSV